MNKTFFLAILAAGACALGAVDAQSPVVVQAADAPPVNAAAPAPVAPTAASDSKNVLQILQEMQATNAAIIMKQQAALADLDLLQKSAEELKIFSKRG
jgi:hypothetical protein